MSNPEHPDDPGRSARRAPRRVRDPPSRPLPRVPRRHGGARRRTAGAARRRRPPGRRGHRRRRSRRGASCSCASTVTRPAGPSWRSPPGRSTATRAPARPRTLTPPPGASWRRRPGTGPRVLGTAHGLLDRARVRHRADLPLPRDGPRRRGTGPPCPRRGRAARAGPSPLARGRRRRRARRDPRREVAHRHLLAGAPDGGGAGGLSRPGSYAPGRRRARALARHAGLRRPAPRTAAR